MPSRAHSASRKRESLGTISASWSPTLTPRSSLRKTEKLAVMDAFLPGVRRMGADLQRSEHLAFSFQRANAREL